MDNLSDIDESDVSEVSINDEVLQQSRIKLFEIGTNLMAGNGQFLEIVKNVRLIIGKICAELEVNEELPETNDVSDYDISSIRQTFRDEIGLQFLEIGLKLYDEDSPLLAAQLVESLHKAFEGLLKMFDRHAEFERVIREED